ncbi:hypothetical protein [Persicitalea jodogahamensis]|uniref:DUF3575 domain-containing protein n=1 Tax=Persicitalea jodogahamensis TaxID=402147 RepID=A0A8J3D8B4_9BACT|nr:hypothetical protein [Persicitalea jodogahamensis]GHB67458.1 hypothetical protein GCM10007390_20960 [Persicitalea jodogahamensis]
MKKLLFILFAFATTTCHAQKQEQEPAVRVHLASSFGLGISGRSKEITGGAFMASLAIPVEFRHQWYLISEVYGGAFRSPKYPKKVGYFFESYPRIRYEAYGIRLGKGIKTIYPEFTLRMSVGADVLLVHEPCCYSISKFSEGYDEKLYRTYAIPAQLDARFRLNKRETAFLTFGGRWDANGRRPFGSLNTGVEFRLFSL